VHALLSGLGLRSPLIAAPMAGGPSTTALVLAAARAGALGFLAAGYKTPSVLQEQLAAVRGVSFGVNLFAPNPVPADPAAYARYAAVLRADGLTVPEGGPVEDDDHWRDKLDLLLAAPVPVVSFTFGIPDRSTVAALRSAGSIVAQTVTSATEAWQAASAGVDALVVQASAAGGHCGTLTPSAVPPPVPLLDLLASVRPTGLPLFAAGGLATPGGVAAALRAGAAAAVVGTVLLRTPESGTSAPYRAALADPSRTQTVVTRAFSGRPARALRNRFVERYDAVAPAGYPAVHHLTAPLRRAAAAAGDAEHINLWAGTGFRHATPTPAADLLTTLAADT